MSTGLEMCNAMLINDESKNIVTKWIYKKYKQVTPEDASFPQFLGDTSHVNCF